MDKGQNFNHPCKGAAIKVHPIRHTDDITAIKTLLARQPRNLCLFTVGINTVYRAGGLLSLTVGQVSDLKTRDRLEIKQDKNQKYRAITLNKTTVDAVQNWLRVHPLYDMPTGTLVYVATRQAIVNGSDGEPLCETMVQGDWINGTLRFPQLKENRGLSPADSS